MKDFLNTLAERSGIGTGEDNISDLRNWGVKIEEDELDRSFDYTDLSEKLTQLIDEGDDLESLKNKHIIDRNAKGKQIVLKKEGEDVIDRTVAYLNSRDFEPFFDYELKKQPSGI